MAQTWLKRIGGVFCALSLALGGVLGSAPTASAQGISLIRDAETEEVLREFTDPILVAANLDPNQVKIYIVQDSTLNAFVALGQNIFIHTGLILATDTPGQLKGVIAHETGHIAGGHLARSREAAGQAAIPVFASILLGVAAIAAGAPDAGAALIAGSQQFGQATFVRFTQVQESSADQAGATFLLGTGQSADGLLEFFEKFRYAEVVSAVRVPPYFRTHPISSDRIESLRERINRAGPQPDAATEELRKFSLIRAKLRGYLEAPATIYARYPTTDTSEAARYARAYAAYRIPDLGSAVRELEALMDMAPDNPFYAELMGQVLFEHQRAEEAIPFQRLSLEMRPGNALLTIALARSLLAAGGSERIAEAETLLARATVLEPDNAFAWSELARAQDSRGEGALARLSTAEAYYAVGRYDLALQFAERAQKEGLPEGSVAERRAADISELSRTQVKDRRG